QSLLYDGRTFSFSVHEPATAESYPLSLHDALPILREDSREATGRYSASTDGFCITEELRPATAVVSSSSRCSTPCARRSSQPARSEEHTSELQSRENLVCRLLLEKKKTKREAARHT